MAFQKIHLEGSVSYLVSIPERIVKQKSKHWFQRTFYQDESSYWNEMLHGFVLIASTEIFFPMHLLTFLIFLINLIVELSKDILGILQANDRRGIHFQVF